MKQKISGPHFFESEYSALYGDRWIPLRESLLKTEGTKAEISNPRGSTSYFLDPISVWVARTLVHFLNTCDRNLMDLSVKNGLRVLDLCAAPGGKSLILLNEIHWSPGSELHCNEPSRLRRERLKTVLREFRPTETDGPTLRVHGKTGQSFGHAMPSYFDAILVDAPCSSEAHVLQDPKELALWTPKRSIRLASQQFSLLESAIHSLKCGGMIAYSTCSIHPRENDAVVSKLFNKYGVQSRLTLSGARSWHLEPWHSREIDSSIKHTHGEATPFGILHLPDRTPGGPLYWAGIKKTGRTLNP